MIGHINDVTLQVKFHYDPITRNTNFQEFKIHLQNWSFAQLRQMGDAIATGTLPNIQLVVRPNPGADEFDILEWKLKRTEYEKKINELEADKRKLFGCIMSNLTTSAENLITTHADFEAARSSGSGIALWTILKEIAAGGVAGESTARKAKRIHDAYRSCKQDRNEDFATFYHRFQNTIKDFTIANVTSPSDADQAMTFLDNLSEHFNDLRYHLAVFNTNYPTTLADAVEIATKHLQKKPIHSNATVHVAKVKCSICNKIGHHESKCWYKDSKPSSNSQPPSTNNVESSVNCSPNRGRGRGKGRGRGGRGKSKTRGKSTHHEESKHDSAQNFLTMFETAADYTIKCKDESYNPNIASTEIIYDTGAQISIFNNKNYLTDLREASTPKQLEGVSINAEAILCNQEGDFKSLGTVYYSQSAATNIISASQVRNFVKNVTYDFDSDSYTINDHDNKVYYFQMNNGLYTLQLEDTKVYTGIISKKEQQTTDLINEMRKRMGFCSFEKLIQLVQNGTYQFPFGTDDVRKAMESTSTSISELKGKRRSKYQSPEKILVDNLTVQRQIILEVDLMLIDKDYYFISIALPLGHMFCEYLPTAPKSSKTILNAINKHISILNSHRFDIIEIHSDDEPGILALREHFGRSGIQLITGTRSSKNTCTPTVDQKISTIKEKARTIINDLPYQIPHKIIKHLITFIVCRMNCMSNASALSPFELLTGRKLQYKRDLRTSFGTFVLLDDPNATNNLNPRRISAISLYPELDQSGNNWFLPLKETHSVPIKRSNWTEVPITDAVIHFINKMSPSYKCDPVVNSLGSQNHDNFDIINELHDNVENYRQSITQRPQQVIQSINHPITNQIQIPVPAVNTQLIIPIQHPQISRNEGPATTPPISTTNTSIESSPSSLSTSIPSTPTPSIDSIDQTTDTIESVESETSTSVEEPQWQNVRRSNRSNFGNWYQENMKPLVKKGYHVTIKDFITMDKLKATEAIINEFQQMKKLKVYEPIKPNTKFESNADLIPVKCINKIKNDSNGKPIKWKSRLVAAGNFQTENTFGDTSSPTIHLSSLYTILNIALHKEMRIITADIVGAYLNAEMNQNVYLKINKQLVPYLLKADPSNKDFINKNGEVIVKLKKALYGCKQSGKLWFEKIKEILTSMNFKQSKFDDCIFQNTNNKVQSIIGLYVDDLIIISPSIEEEKLIIKRLQEKVYGITVNHGKDQEYLGMHLDISKESIRINMNGYVDEILKANNITSSVTTPANSRLFNINSKLPLLPEKNQNEIRSIVYKLLYLSNRMRMDIAVAVNFLCTRTNKYTIEDQFKLNRILKYLYGTKYLPLIFNKSKQFNVNIMCDASHGSHIDGKGQGGTIVLINNNPIFFRSRKLKINSLSSTESELICVSDALSPIINVMNIIEELGIKINNKTLYQDNISTIKMIENEKATTMKTKHINLRYFTIKERIKDLNIIIKYLPTRQMLADLLTKAIQGNAFVELRNKLMNNID